MGHSGKPDQKLPSYIAGHWSRLQDLGQGSWCSERKDHTEEANSCGIGYDCSAKRDFGTPSRCVPVGWLVFCQQDPFYADTFEEPDCNDGASSIQPEKGIYFQGVSGCLRTIPSAWISNHSCCRRRWVWTTETINWGHARRTTSECGQQEWACSRNWTTHPCC